MNESTFRARLHAHLDARRDPLDDAELVAFATEHPEWLEHLVGLRADAREVAVLGGAAAPVARRGPVRRRTWLVAAGCTAAAAAAVLAVFTRDPLPPTPRPAGRILAAGLTEQLPRAHAAAGCVTTELVLATPTHSLTTWTAWSERR